MRRRVCSEGFLDLAGRPDYARIRTQLARYVHETIPDPARTRDILWSLSALPSTSRTADRRRLFTLNAGSVEILILTEWDLADGETELEWTMNIWPDGVIGPLEALTGDWLEGASYRESDAYKNAGPVVTIDCIGTEVFARALDQAVIIDAAHRLNVTMRRARTIRPTPQPVLRRRSDPRHPLPRKRRPRPLTVIPRSSHKTQHRPPPIRVPPTSSKVFRPRRRTTDS